MATTIAQQAGYLARKNKNIAGDGVGDGDGSSTPTLNRFGPGYFDPSEIISNVLVDGDGNPILNHEFQLILTD